MKRYSEQQFFGFPTVVDAGFSIRELHRQQGSREASLSLWRRRFGGHDYPIVSNRQNPDGVHVFSLIRWTTLMHALDNRSRAMKKLVPSLVLSILLSGPAISESQPRAYIISPDDGAIVGSPVTVVFGLEGFGVAPAGTVRDKTGHHHLIIDAPLPPLDQPIPANDHYRHFGGGQTQTTVELAPGEHTLQLLLGDHAHMPHSEPVTSDVITITVE